MMLFKIVIDMALFWLAMIFVTQHHHLDWRGLILWYLLAYLLSAVIFAIAIIIVGQEMMLIANMIHLIVFVILLIAIMYFKYGIDSPKLIALTLVTFFGSVFVFELVISFFIKINSSIFWKFIESSG
jgi:hypothetical protein